LKQAASASATSHPQLQDHNTAGSGGGLIYSYVVSAALCCAATPQQQVAFQGLGGLHSDYTCSATAIDWHRPAMTHLSF